MDPDGDSQPTQQATQNVVDPRRLGKQNSGFSDDDISDIICLLLPYSESARREVSKIALRSSRHMVARDDADTVDIDYNLEDEAGLFELTPRSAGEHAIVLRLSAQVKNPLQGFTFGRNASRCDICFTNDPHKRLSNIHFRIYLNEYGVLMLEDQSTNGTVVDGTLLKSKSRPREETRRTLTSGTKIQILMHAEALDLEFLVRIPRREGEYERAYRENLVSYMHRLQSLADEQAETIAPGPTGHVDLFPVTEPAQGARTARPTRGSPLKLLPETTQDNVERLPREWRGSNKYNRVGQIGKGAFATVYKVTSKFDGKPYAAKELDKRKFMKNGVLDQKVENEMNIMQKIEHPHIVSYIEHLDWDDRLFIIIMEYVPAGDLGRFISERGALPETVVKEMSRQLIDALGYLHANNITHRDVKPDNILIQSHQPFNVKLTDFGLSKMVDNEQTFLRTFCGTLLYCAPEVYTEFAEYDEYGRRHPRNKHRRQAYGQRYDHAVDIWSLGGVIFYALTGSPPYPVKTGISYSELLHQIMTKKLDISPLVKHNISADGIDFLTHMLQRRPEQRATVQDLQGHPWLGGQKSSKSFDDFSDDNLGQKASQLSLLDSEQAQHIPQSQSDDEIIEDDFYDENQFSDFESQKENYTFGQGGQPGKLFGEVNVSAIGSSGVIPSNRLNLPISADSFGATEILDPEVRDSFESEDSSTPRQKKPSQHSGGVRLSAYPSHSVDELNNMTFDVESQSLGGAESIMENLNMKSAARLTMPPSNANSFTTSKRKPSHDTSDEFDGPRIADKPTIKRLKSDTQMESLSDIENGEYELLAAIPPISRLHSGRQIDTPVHKSSYWNAQDKKTWHLRYPEMTQLQLNAFRAAAEARGEVFAPGTSVFWELAMSYFPPANDSEVHPEPPSPVLDLSVGGVPLKTENDDPESIPKESDLPPPTLGPDDLDALPDTLPPENNIIVPIPIDPPRNRVVATLQSSPGSVVSGVSIDITQSVTSWGRAADNTHVYPVKMDGKVPKYAFKLIVWKDGFDPAKNFRPWNSTGVLPNDFAFYISTKATNGIQVNGMALPSYEPKRPAGPSKNWIRLYDGDVIVIWRTGIDSTQAKLTFRCTWGGSSKPRPSVGSTPPPVFVPESISKRLDDACHRAEKRIGGLAEQELRIEAADAEFQERERNIERERQRSKAFELKRIEACRFLSARASRRGSPATAQQPTQDASRASHAPSNATPGPTTANTAAGGKMAPPFRHASPGISRLQAMAKDN